MHGLAHAAGRLGDSVAPQVDRQSPRPQPAPLAQHHDGAPSPCRSLRPPPCEVAVRLEPGCAAAGHEAFRCSGGQGARAYSKKGEGLEEGAASPCWRLWCRRSFGAIEAGEGASSAASWSIHAPHAHLALYPLQSRQCFSFFDSNRMAPQMPRWVRPCTRVPPTQFRRFHS